MSTSDADELGRTAPLEVPPEPTSPATAPPAEDGAHPVPPSEIAEAAQVAPATAEPEVVYVPLAITIGDGLKFGCGFFLALVIVLLVGFVLIAALLLLTTLLGLNLPITR